jgi:hypothetical protein
MRDMWQPIVGSEAIRNGHLTRGGLRWNYTAVHPRVYVPNGVGQSVLTNAHAAWLWTSRRGVIAGRAAAAGVIVREERIVADEITEICGLPVTTPARTALDLGRHLPRNAAVANLDALAAATGVTAAAALELAGRYRGARGVRRARIALALMDSGAQSPKETWLRLILVDDGLPAPRTQIEVSDGTARAFIDMGYDEPKVGLDYEGAHHSAERRQYVHDIGRGDLVDRQGWIDLRVVAEHSRRFTLDRVRAAFARRGWTPPPPPSSAPWS